MMFVFVFLRNENNIKIDILLEERVVNALEAVGMIDISTVRTHHTLSDIKEVVEIAKEYKFINVHALPCWVA